jgi:hypothetical protein
LAREPQVIDQALNSLAEALTKCEQLYFSYKTIDSKLSSSTVPLLDGSVLIRELAQAENPLDAVNCPSQTPLLHSICSIHSFIYLLITLGKINQNDVRNLTINKWGSELGCKVLKDLCKLYMNLIWESSMLLWLCNEEQQQQQLQQLQHFYQLQLSQIQDVAGLSQQASSVNTQLSQLIQQFATTANNFEFNRNDLDRLRNYLNNTSAAAAAVAAQLVPPPPPPPPPSQCSTTLDNNPPVETMETLENVTTGSSSFIKHEPPVMPSTPFPASVSQVSYSKLLRPLFNCSSKLGRSLCELFGLLVKLSAGSPWKNANARRNMIHHLHNNLNNLAPSQAAINVASAIADISINGFSQQRFSFTENVSQQLSANITDSKQKITPTVENLHPKFRLTFYICSIGFASSILFDEQKRPYHLMLQRFDQSGGLKSLFDAFHWSLSLLNNNCSPDSANSTAASASSSSNEEPVQQQSTQDRDKLQEGTLEFIEAWLNLIQKLVNTKNMLETRHSLSPTSSSLSGPTSDMKKACSFDPIKFLFKVHKESFQALMCLWDNKSFIIRENYSLSETVLNILCQILVGDSQLQKKLAEQQAQSQQPQQITQQAQQPSNINASNLSSSLRTSIQNVRDARAQFLAAMQDVNGSLPSITMPSINPGASTTPSIPTVPSSNEAASSGTTAASSNAQAVRQLTPIDQEIIEQMISMGFSPELAQEAVMRSPPDSLEQAVDYCFNHPTAGTASTLTSAGSATVVGPTTPATSNASSETETVHQPLIETPSLDQVIMGAISSATLDEVMPSSTTQSAADAAVSLPPPHPSTTMTASNPIPVLVRTQKPIATVIPAASTPSTEPISTTPDETHQLDKAILDRFANTMLPGLMKILDNVPDTVYRVCDLIVVVVRKYGSEWRDDCLSFMLNEICELIKQVCSIYQLKSNKNDEDAAMSDEQQHNKTLISNAFIEQKLASRLLLFCLLFEEMQLPCAKMVNASNLLDKLVSMLQMVTMNSSSSIKHQHQKSESIQTPVWLTSLFILVDLIEKAALATKRKAAINDNFQNQQRIWKWYEERQNRWIQYAYANNKTIDNAYKNGETSVRIVASRKHYIIHFNTMLQENEETLHKRPIMLSFEKPATTSTATVATASNTDSNAEMTTASNESVSSYSASNSSTAPSASINQSRPSSPLPTEVVNGLMPSQTSAVIESCVELISWPVSDPDCLHAILRLILRLTRQYEYAIEFAANRGPQHILNLSQRNSFMGYASLITLIFRHICEDEKNLRLTMEKAIRLALSGSQINIAGLQPGGIGTRELHNVLRLLGPAICRHPDLFCEVAVDILRIIIRREDENSLLNTTNINTLQQIIQQPLSNNTAYCLRTVMAKLMPPTPMPDYARVLVIDLLNYLIKPVVESSKSTSCSKTTTTAAAAAATSDSKQTDQTSGTSSSSSKFSKSASLTQTNGANILSGASAHPVSMPLISKSGVLRILSELGKHFISALLQ